MNLVRSHIGAWIIFLLLGAGMWCARYENCLSPQQFGWLTAYGPYVVVLMHVIITLTAFHDSIFQGILCIVVPFYSLYYLFLVSDAFYLRAICGGLLVGVGADSAVFFQDVANEVIARVNSWIAAGGTPEKLPK